jgi:hypothetical protein
VNRKKPGRVDSFVNGTVLGVGFAGHEFARAQSFGGGVNYWFKPRIALRTEGRLYGVGGEFLLMFRVGFTFR